jgi:hypothetical protein
LIRVRLSLNSCGMLPLASVPYFTRCIAGEQGNDGEGWPLEALQEARGVWLGPDSGASSFGRSSRSNHLAIRYYGLLWTERSLASMCKNGDGVAAWPTSCAFTSCPMGRCGHLAIMMALDCRPGVDCHAQ